jgi:hypothetical protein
MEGRPITQSRQLSIPALDPIIRRCLRVSPDERYQTAEELLADLRRLAAGSSASALPETADTAAGLWWWRFHQVTTTVVDACTPVLVGLAGDSMNKRVGTALFFVALALATAAVTLRLNLLFTLRVHATMLAVHRAKLFRWIAGAELALAVLMLGAAVAVTDVSPVIAGFLVSLSIVMVASLALIEPATTGSAGLYEDERGPDRTAPKHTRD